MSFVLFFLTTCTFASAKDFANLLGHASPGDLMACAVEEAMRKPDGPSLSAIALPVKHSWFAQAPYGVDKIFGYTDPGGMALVDILEMEQTGVLLECSSKLGLEMSKQ